jgi:hypothetical protein
MKTEKYTGSLIHSTMEFISNIKVTKCSLTLNGLMICYSKTNGMTVLQFDKYASCSMLVRIGVIEDFIFNSWEPVILTLNVRPGRYRLELWSEFVLNFVFTLEMAQNIIQEYQRHRSRLKMNSGDDNEDVNR